MPPTWAGRDVAALETDGEAKVIAVSRLGVSQLARPALVIQDGDLVYAAVSGDKIAAFDDWLSGAAAGAH